jgi:alginate O-acetyltransferase complex protein AlgJ
MSLPSTGYLPDRPRPAWFGTALVALFIAMLLTAFGGIFRTQREAPTLFEKRATAPLPEPPRTLSELRTYPTRFEQYFDDHFGLRNQLVRLDHFAKVLGFGVSPVSKVLVGKSGWLYFKGEDTKAFDRWYRGSEPFSDAEVASLRDELLRRNDFLAGAGIPFLVVVVPEKYSVYREFLPDWAARLTARTSLDRIGTELARYPRLRFIDLRGALHAAKGAERLYYRTDSHWNYLGAGVGYAVIMREVARVLPDIKVAPVSRPPFVAGVDYYSGDLAQMLGLPSLLREDDIAPLGKILATPESRCAQRDFAAETPEVEVYVYRCANAPSFTALVYRDSNAIPLIPMLAENFARSTFVSSAQLDPALVMRLRPDLVIEELVERTLNSPAVLPMPR